MPAPSVNGPLTVNRTLAVGMPACVHGHAQSEAALSTISAQILWRQSTHFQYSRSPRMLLFYPRAGVERGGEWKMQFPGHHHTPILELLAGGPGSLILHRFPNSFSSTLKFEISKQKDSGNLGPVTEAG